MCTESSIAQLMNALKFPLVIVESTFYECLLNTTCFIFLNIFSVILNKDIYIYIAHYCYCKNETSICCNFELNTVLVG